MKVISIIEPWATLIKEGKKCIETRSWKTNYRGEIYIHASVKKISKSSPEIQNLLKLIPNVTMNYGYIICKANLVDCKYMDEEFIENIKKNLQEYICGVYGIGRYAWILKDIAVLENPISVKGYLGIWNYYNQEEV
ncbi:MAG: ASCH domain-containing protein [Oscillospiraceae bacterium]|nr:ASCH domain-containing protein [Oscillospiraceae bacterium]